LVIPNLTNKPKIKDSSIGTIYSLTIQSGAIFNFNGYGLTISTYVVNSGTITCTGTEQISVGGNWTVNSGQYSPLRKAQ